MSYPETYGKQTKAIPDIKGPLNIDQQGDSLVPSNDMSGVAGKFGSGGSAPDPLGVINNLGKGK